MLEGGTREIIMHFRLFEAFGAVLNVVPLRSLLITSLEILLAATNLYLFSYGYPDAIRMSLWEEGGAKLFNSDPKKRIYFFANHQEPPEIPYIWSQM
jgi:hypothetical protein